MRFGFDPLGAMAMRGTAPMPWPELAPLVAGLIGDLVKQGFAGPFAVADGRPVHAAGGSEAQELAFVLANAVAYLRALEAGGIALETARRLIYFRLAADQDQFLTTAKFRAVRKLWARVEEACGLEPLPVFLAAETAWRMMTKRDPHGNIVRGTIAALAAAVGGADAVTVLPFSSHIARSPVKVFVQKRSFFLSPLKSPVPLIDHSTGTVPINAFVVIVLPFINQITRLRDH